MSNICEVCTKEAERYPDKHRLCMEHFDQYIRNAGRCYTDPHDFVTIEGGTNAGARRCINCGIWEAEVSQLPNNEAADIVHLLRNRPHHFAHDLDAIRAILGINVPNMKITVEATFEEVKTVKDTAKWVRNPGVV